MIASLPGMRDTGPDAGERDAVGIENVPGEVFDPIGIDIVDAVDRFLQRNGAAPKDLLPGQLAGARGRAFQRHQQAGANLIAHALDLVLGDGFGDKTQFVEDDRHQFAHLLLAGGRGNAEDTAIGEGPVKSIDRIAQAPLFADLLEKTRAHAATKDGGENLHGVKAFGIIGASFETKHDMGLFVVFFEPLFTAHIMGLGGLGGPIRLQAGKAGFSNLDQRLMIDVAGRGQDHLVADIVAVHIAANGLGPEALHRVDGAQNGATDGLIGIGGGLEEVEDLVVGRIARGTDFLDDHMLFAGKLVLIEAGILQDIGKNIGGQSHVFLEDAGKITRVLDGGCRVQVAADGLYRFGDLAGRAGLGSLEGHMFEQMGDAVLVFVLGSRAGFDPNSERGTFQMWHGVGDDHHAVIQFGCFYAQLYSSQARVRDLM